MAHSRIQFAAMAAALAAWAGIAAAADAPAPAASAAPFTPARSAGQWIADARGCKVWSPQPPQPGFTVLWSGACDSEGLAQGLGELRWTNTGGTTSAYQGEMKAGRRSGRGVLTLQSGLRYEGGFANDQFNGPGELRMPGGTTLQGNFVEGRIDGPGRIDFANGDRYAGHLRRSSAFGAGRYAWARGDSYEGEFAGGQPSGTGEYRFADGAVYRGVFAQGVPAGRGRLTLADGLGYEGHFEAGTPTSPGALFHTGGATPEDSLDTRMKLSLRYAAAQRLASPRSLVSAGMICKTMPRPSLPVVNWRGMALYQVVATVTDGKVTAMEATVMVPGIPREVNRALVQSIHEALQRYDCPGDHVFQQDFQFAVQPGPAGVSP